MESAGGTDSSFPREAEGFLFAPVDITPWEATGKDNMHGIGYRGMQEQHVLGARKATKALYGMSGEVGGLGGMGRMLRARDNQNTALDALTCALLRYK